MLRRLLRGRRPDILVLKVDVGGVPGRTFLGDLNLCVLVGVVVVHGLGRVVLGGLDLCVLVGVVVVHSPGRIVLRDLKLCMLCRVMVVHVIERVLELLILDRKVWSRSRAGRGGTGLLSRRRSL